jgi:asparagine synthase (glutamine-hydrolysing)
MCGIAGFVDKSGAAAAPTRIDHMTDLVAHRGPDGRGTYLAGSLALGHRRLAILDLSDHGHQPMCREAQGLAITFNGEIYNYLELRTELAQKGHVFQTKTDTEVILAAYTEWGEACVDRFNGMWAFAIHDRSANRLFLSRDRFGIKPLYYCDAPTTFAFGSEIKQLLPALKERRADLDALHVFLITGGIDLGHETLFKGIRKLPAGVCATYDLENHRLSLRRYYETPFREDVSRLSLDAAVDLYGGLLTDAVRLQLRSDVRVGTCLSGGLDSSSVATLAAELYGHESPFSAITAISEALETDESRYAEAVVASHNLQWHRVRPSYADFVDSLPRIVQSQEEPFGGPTLTMQHFVMKAARDNGIPVLLDGQGGDETLLGYPKYLAMHLAQCWRDDGPAGVWQALVQIPQHNAGIGRLAMAKYFLGGRLASARFRLEAHAQPAVRHAARTPPHLRALAKAARDPFELQSLEISSTNLPVLLRYEDKSAMAHGVEARLPFLDHRVVEVALSLPLRYKLRDGWTKWLLRRLMAGRLPEAIAWRRNKLSFDAPDRIWLGRHRPEMQRAILASDLLRSVTHPRRLKVKIGRISHRSLWRLYSVALWELGFGISS